MMAWNAEMVSDVRDEYGSRAGLVVRDMTAMSFGLALGLCGVGQSFAQRECALGFSHQQLPSHSHRLARQQEREDSVKFVVFGL